MIRLIDMPNGSQSQCGKVSCEATDPRPVATGATPTKRGASLLGTISAQKKPIQAEKNAKNHEMRYQNDQKQDRLQNQLTKSGSDVQSETRPNQTKPERTKMKAKMEGNKQS